MSRLVCPFFHIEATDPGFRAERTDRQRLLMIVTAIVMFLLGGYLYIRSEQVRKKGGETQQFCQIQVQ